MPYLRIQTNHAVDAETKQQTVRTASKLISEQTGKPERYVMVDYAPDRPMVFAGSDAPCAYVELKSIGMPRDRTREFSHALCELLESSISVPADRIYIEFTDAEREMWGWNGATF
jgi:phenylpyruvate tautomerase